MPLCFRAPGISLRIEDLLARVRPSRAARELVRGERMRWARTQGVGKPWLPGPPVRDLSALAPPGAAFWLDAAAAESAVPREPAEELELELAPLAWRAGEVSLRGGAGFRFETLAAGADRARVRVRSSGASAAGILAWCAQAGAPAVGDLAHGGSLAQPGEPLFAPGGALRISEAAARALVRGHPWLTRDRESEDEGRFAVGSIVSLRDAGGHELGVARIEGGPQLVARMWASAPRKDEERRPSKPPSIEERALHALARRERLLAAGETDALRLVHGEADALPGLFVDRYGPTLRVLVAGRAALPLWERASAVLASALAKDLGCAPSVVLALALRPTPPGELECVRLVSGPEPPDPLVVRERTLRIRVELGLREPTHARAAVGLFTDQRANRARLASRVRSGGRYLNLFAHTGAFSAALLAAGAAEVTSVDLSAPYLAELEQNLERSGLDRDRHRGVKRDARRFLAELPDSELFDGIVVDPPTAAAVGRNFWSARGGLAELAEHCIRHLAPDGFLLVTSNDRSARGAQLAEIASAAAGRVGARVRLGDAAPSADSPNLRGFPEGAAFKGVLAERSA